MNKLTEKFKFFLKVSAKPLPKYETSITFLSFHYSKRILLGRVVENKSIFKKYLTRIM